MIAGGFLSSGALEQLLSGFDSRHLLGLVVVQPLILMGLVLQGFRHAMLIDRPGLSYLVTTKAVILSQGLNFLLPARLSEVLKATYLRDRANIPMSIGLSAVVLERTVDLIIVGILGIVSLFFFTTIIRNTLIFWIIFTIVGILGVAFFGKNKILALLRGIPWQLMGGFLERIYIHFSSSLRSPKFFLSLGIGLLIWSLSFVNIFLLIEYAGSMQIGLYGALLVFVLTTLGGAIPALPGGLGTYEAAAVFALMSQGYLFADALTLAITIHGAQLILPLILAFGIMLTERLGLSSLIADLRNNVSSQRD